jgi:hypothetical protein
VKDPLHACNSTQLASFLVCGEAMLLNGMLLWAAEARVRLMVV